MKGLSLQQLSAKIYGMRDLKRDYIADTSMMTMQIQPAQDEAKPRPVLEVPKEGFFPILPLAHNQIADRTGVPTKYYDKCLNEAPDLLATNVNAWFRIHPEKRMVRTLGGDTRAFLSNRYNRIENEEIASIVLPILDAIPDVEFVSTEVTDRRMYIQAVTPRIQGEVKKGDVVQAGVVISNSEVGCGAVSVAPMIYRLVCLNGMIMNDGRFRANHIGRQVQDSEQLWKDDTRQADDRAVLLKVRDMVTNAVNEVTFRDRIEAMSGLTTVKITGNPASAVEVLSQKIGASETEKGDLLRALIEGADLSAWAMVNAVTGLAHGAKDYDRSVELETIGGKLVELAPTEWKQVLEAV